MKATNNQIIGNRGEIFVSYILSKYCLVRQTSNGTDIGVDLYCESIIENKPHHHFWVQVKSSKEEKTKESFKKKHIEYWWRQPIPVFVFLVSLDHGINSSKFKIHVINLTKKYFKNSKIKDNSKTFHSDFVLQSEKDIKDFVLDSIPISIARIKLKNDYVIIPTQPKTNIEYKKNVYYNDSYKFAREILVQISRSAGFLLKDILSQKKDDSDLKMRRKQLEMILETYSKGWGKWEIPYHIGLSKLEDGNLDEAEDAFKRAFNKLENDDKIDWKNEKAEILSKLEIIYDERKIRIDEK